jgi:hypothetical protein
VGKAAEMHHDSVLFRDLANGLSAASLNDWNFGRVWW